MRAILSGLLGGALIMLLFSFGCRKSDDPPGNGTTTDDHGNDRMNATTVVRDTPVSGNIETGDDEDHFSIQLNGDGILTATTTGEGAIGGIYDSEGNELATENNEGDTGTNSNVSAAIPSPGTYSIKVISSGMNTGMYDLTVTFIPDHGDDRMSAALITDGTSVVGHIETGADEDYFFIVLTEDGILRATTTGGVNTAGTLYNSEGTQLNTDNNSGEGMNFNVSAPIASAGTYYVRVASEGTDTGMYTLTATFIPDDHGDEISSSTPATIGTPIAGIIEKGTDDDYFSIEVTSADLNNIDLRILTATTTGTTDTVGTLYNSEGTRLKTDDNSGEGMNFSFFTHVVSPGTYYIKVEGSSAGMYTLSITSMVGDHGGDRMSATPFTSGMAVTGDIEASGDEDYFSIQVTTLMNDLTTLRAVSTGSTDTMGTIYDSGGTKLAEDDNSGTDMNFDVSYVIPSPGTYYIRMRGSGSAAGNYGLTITVTSREYGNAIANAEPVTSGMMVDGNIDPGTNEDYFSIQTDSRGTLMAMTTGSTDTMGTILNSRGDTLATDDNSGTDMNFDVSYRVTTRVMSTYYIRVTSENNATGSYRLTVTFIDDDHGNTRTTATPVTSSVMAITGNNIELGNDADYFSIETNSRGTLMVMTAGSTDTVGHIYDSGGTELATDDNSGTDMNFDVSYRVTTRVMSTYYIRVTSSGSATGTYDLTVTFIADDHGNTRTTATLVTSGTAEGGNIELGDDEDYFSIQVTPTNDRTILRAFTTGTTDTVGELYDIDGTTLLATDDDGGTGMNFDISSDVIIAGTYYIRVRSKGTGTGTYSLTVTATSADHGNTRATATPLTGGQPVATGEIEPADDNDHFSFQVDDIGILAVNTGADEKTATVVNSGGTTVKSAAAQENPGLLVSITNPGTYYLNLTDAGAYTLSLTLPDHGDERAYATSVSSGSAVSGHIQTSDDEDYFFLVVPSGATLTAISTGGIDTIGHLYNADGTQLATNDDGGEGTNFSISHTTTTPGAHYVRVTSKNNATGRYRLTITSTGGDHGNTRAAATPLIASGVPISGNITPGNDKDYFSFVAGSFSAIGATTTGSTDTKGSLYTNLTSMIPSSANDNDGSGTNFQISGAAGDTTGTHYIEVASKRTATGVYTLTITFDEHVAGATGAISVTSGTPVVGALAAGDRRDTFSITVPGAGTIRATSQSSANYLSLRGIIFGTGTDGNLVRLAVDNADYTMGEFNFDVSAAVTEAGTYFVDVRAGERPVATELLAPPITAGIYTLTVTFTPSP